MNKLFLGLIMMGMIRCAPDDGGGGGGGGDGKGGDGKGGKSDADIIKDLQAQITERDGKIKELSDKPKPKDDPSLNDRVKQEREEKDKKDGDQKALESAIRFSLQSEKFIKEHESILPKEVGDFFTAAEKEKYDSPIQKANAIKSAIIQSFFSVQANVDKLTPSHKNQLEDYLKLTKNGKEERAQSVFENIFEPSLEITKQIKKAEEITKAKNGYNNSSDADKAYKEKLMGLSKKHYLGEKK